MRVAVKVLLKNEVLDSQGRAVEAIAKSGGNEVNSIRVGRYIVLDLPTEDQKQALNRAGELAQAVLHNPLIETFELEVLQ